MVLAPKYAALASNTRHSCVMACRTNYTIAMAELLSAMDDSMSQFAHFVAQMDRGNAILAHACAHGKAVLRALDQLDSSPNSPPILQHVNQAQFKGGVTNGKTRNTNVKKYSTSRRIDSMRGDKHPVNTRTSVPRKQPTMQFRSNRNRRQKKNEEPQAKEDSYAGSQKLCNEDDDSLQRILVRIYSDKLQISMQCNSLGSSTEDQRV